MDPLVQQYLAEKLKKDQEVEAARKNSELMAGLASAGELAGNIVGNKPFIAEKGWNETGAPSVQNFGQKMDLSALKASGARGLQAAQENRNQALADFENQQKFQDMNTARDRNTVKFAQDQAKFGQDVEKSNLDLQKTRYDIEKDQALDDVNSPDSKALAKIGKMPNATGRQVLIAKPFLLESWQQASQKSIADLTTSNKKEAAKFSKEQGLADDFQKHPVVTEYRKVTQSANELENFLNNKTALSSQSAVVLLNKLLDPSSVVREGEFDRAMQAQGLKDRIANLANQIEKGNKVSPEMAAQMRQIASQYKMLSNSNLDRFRAGFDSTIKTNGLDPNAVYRDLTPNQRTETPAPPPKRKQLTLDTL